MREIKFRAWDKKKKAMYKVSSLSTNTLLLSGSHPHATREKGDVELMQYTGLKDKKGQEIYESDIVRVRHSKKGKKRDELREVVWNGAGFNLTGSTYADYEVIGNIWESPELLEVDND